MYHWPEFPVKKNVGKVCHEHSKTLHEYGIDKGGYDMEFLFFVGVFCIGLVVLRGQNHDSHRISGINETEYTRQLRKAKREIEEIRERSFQSFTRPYA